MFEDNVSNLDTVILHYQTAADYFKGEESTSSANKCLVKVAEYSATLEKYDKAIKIYEQVRATMHMDMSLEESHDLNLFPDRH